MPQPLYMAPGPANGLVQPGNTDLTQLPVINNGDGTWSTVNSTSFQDEKTGSPTFGKEVLVRGILNGKRVDPDRPEVLDALRQQYYKDGRHLGVFKDGSAADAYGERLHSDWEAGKIPGVQMRAGDPNAKNQPSSEPNDWQNVEPNDWQDVKAEQPQQPQELPTFQAIRHGMENAAEAANPMGMIRGFGSAVLHPIDTARQFINTSGEQAKRAGQEFSHGNISSGIAHTVAATPVLGSALVKPLHQMEEENDPAGGIGTLLGTAATAALTPIGAAKTGRFAEGAAPSLAETALRIPSKARAFGATPGRALINETSGFKPADIAQSAGTRIGDLTNQLHSAVGQSPFPFDLGPARARVASAQNLATLENTPTINRQLIPLKRSLETDFSSKQPIPQLVSARQGLDLRRGFGKEHAEFNPNVSGEVNNVAKSTYHDLSDELHRAVPGSAQTDQSIQSLIPVQKAASKMALEPTTGQRMLIKIARPAGNLIGTGLGYHFGGPIGAGLGYLGSEALTNPAMQIRIARRLSGGGQLLQSAPSRAAARVAPLIRPADDSQ